MRRGVEVGVGVGAQAWWVSTPGCLVCEGGESEGRVGPRGWGVLWVWR